MQKTLERRKTGDLIGKLKEDLHLRHPEQGHDGKNNQTNEHILELRSITSATLQEAGVVDPGVTAEELKAWSQTLQEICQSLALVGSKHLMDLIEIYAELKAAEEKTRLRNMNLYIRRGK